MSILSILYFLVSIVTLVLAILVLIKLFQKEGALKGILGIICMLYTFVWGWMNAKTLGITNIMWGWTACIIVMVILQFIMGPSAVQMPQ